VPERSDIPEPTESGSRRSDPTLTPDERDFLIRRYAAMRPQVVRRFILKGCAALFLTTLFLGWLLGSLVFWAQHAGVVGGCALGALAGCFWVFNNPVRKHHRFDSSRLTGGLIVGGITGAVLGWIFSLL
jgi:hypothetical protein